VAVTVSILVAILLTVLGATAFRANKAAQLLLSGAVYIALISATIIAVDAKMRANEVENNAAVLRFDVYESFLNAPNRPQPADGIYKVGIMGDSTFVNQKNRSDVMPSQLEKKLHATEKDLELQTLHFAGLDAFAFYQLVNRMIEDEVNLIVIPVNLRSFGGAWTQKTPNFLTLMNSYIPLSELPFLFSLGAKSDIKMSHVILDTIDASFFDKRYHELKYKAVTEYRDFENKHLTSFEKRFASHTTQTTNRRKMAIFRQSFATEVTKHHPYIPMFQRINVLAAKHDVKIMYYTVQVNPRMIKPGIYLPEPQFEACRELFGTGDNVYFEDITDVIPPENFDNFSHLDGIGIQLVADTLATKITAIKNEKQ